MASTSTVGAMAPPAGVTADFSLTRTTLQEKFILVYSITFGLACFLLLLRLYTRVFVVRSVGLDDYFVVGSVVFSAGFFGLCVESMKYGFGRHLWNVSVASLEIYLKYLIPIVITYTWTPFCTKLSILLLYHRLNPTPKFRYCIYALIFIITGYTLATTFATAAGCNPTHSDQTPCINSLALWLAILNIATDFLMLFLPIPMLWTLHLPVMQKATLALIFAIGSTSVVTSIIRITYIMEILHKADFTWSEATVCVWSAIELNFGVMCNCLAVLKPFVRTHLPMLFPSTPTDEEDRYPRSHSGARRKADRAGSHPLSSLDKINRSTEHDHGESSDPPVYQTHHGIVVTNSYRVEANRGDTESTKNFLGSTAQE
ncbi:hypothetical protein ASPZODRAFT_137495 [Penicilliopsis zonata CBS 506.65]|uniref:Rhodopsin domain-containing protein n=1 Tax=Penicilliopsis zonata CBS 506.65 TaxID=1073090 RepID=A0A1L9S4L3_9EURO|nr:hypothetical protein ASPZODRAFT_137495 [Penicilliopsis zonata CBS 506.65]OJJ42109.1 hypothetical protein ASPZODRAFT_137495 [Penicilliopsis zonata CBS 506.65]